MLAATWRRKVLDCLAIATCSRCHGLAAVEFERDPRDDKCKLIECNARVTAPTELLQASSCKVAMLIYNRALRRRVERFVQSQAPTRLWLPFEDFQSFRTLQRRGELTLAAWLLSIMHPHPHALFPLFRPASHDCI